MLVCLILGLGLSFRLPKYRMEVLAVIFAVSLWHRVLDRQWSFLNPTVCLEYREQLCLPPQFSAVNFWEVRQGRVFMGGGGARFIDCPVSVRPSGPVPFGAFSFLPFCI